MHPSCMNAVLCMQCMRLHSTRHYKHSAAPSPCPTHVLRQHQAVGASVAQARVQRRELLSGHMHCAPRALKHSKAGGHPDAAGCGAGAAACGCSSPALLWCMARLALRSCSGLVAAAVLFHTLVRLSQVSLLMAADPPAHASSSAAGAAATARSQHKAEAAAPLGRVVDSHARQAVPLPQLSRHLVHLHAHTQGATSL